VPVGQAVFQWDRFLHGDAFEILPDVPDGSVDLVLTDPPYGIDYQSNRRVVWEKLPKFQGDRDLEWLSVFVDEAYRVLANHRHLYCFCRWDRYPVFAEAISRRFQIKNALVWVKSNHGSGDLRGAYAPQYEMVIFAGKGRRQLRGKRHPDVLLKHAAVSSRARKHPVQKPVDLLRFLIEKSTKPGEVVLDPFAGVGSTVVAALQTGRRYLGIEIDGRFYGEGVELIAEAVGKLMLPGEDTWQHD
jgi:site-specific DNA-methyltransferase (adenine-specific)